MGGLQYFGDMCSLQFCQRLRIFLKIVEETSSNSNAAITQSVLWVK
jgi:hypothetical protein